MPLSRGLVHVYTGEGKGKTTAAIGLALRAAGHGLKVHIVQFMKGGPESGELIALRRQPNITVRRFGTGRFVNLSQPGAEDLRQAHLAVCHILDLLRAGGYDILVLDELNVALHARLVSLDQVLSILAARPSHVELVLTGRGAHAEIIERADIVTEMRAVKHPFTFGVPARRGIEF
jgi:cob(I)alamin adenosyltransferase